MFHEVNPYVSHLRQGIDMMREQGASDVRTEIVIIMPGYGYTEGVATRDIVAWVATSVSSMTLVCRKEI